MSAECSVDSKDTGKIKYDFEVAVIGSGFGGSIAAIELANVFKKRGQHERVCLLERGAWHTSPESWPEELNKEVPKFMKNRPREFWSMPDNSRGLVTLLGKLRNPPPTGKFWYFDWFLKLWYRSLSYQKNINPYGLYDLKRYKETYAIVASGVGGGSLVYSGVLALPEPEILDDVYYEKDRGGEVADPNKIWKPKWKIPYDQLEPYMMYAKYKFIEANKVSTIQAGYDDVQDDDFMLAKTRTFRDAWRKLSRNPNYDITFEISDLAIKAYPTWNPTKHEWDTAFCRREGRCNLGCLPGARNTLNKKLARAIGSNPQEPGLPIDIYELAEVTKIRPVTNPKSGIADGENGYVVEFYDWRPQIFINNDQDAVRKSILERSQNGKYRSCWIRVKRLILSAGSYGTTELILRSIDEFKELKGDQAGHKTSHSIVGSKHSRNGDSYGFISPTKNAVYSARGPINTAQMRYGLRYEKDPKHRQHRFTIEDASIPRMAAGVFATVLDIYFADKRSKQSPTGRFDIFAKLGRIEMEPDRTVFKALRKFISEPRPFETKEDMEAWNLGMEELPSGRVRSLVKFSEKRYDELTEDYRVSRLASYGGMGIDRADGRAQWSEEAGLEVEWPTLCEKDKRDPIFDEIADAMTGLAREVVDDGILNKPADHYLVTKPWSQLFKGNERIFVLHPLGGCPMETCGNDGAVDEYGRLLKKEGKDIYKNIYIADGSIIPTALGVNPSLTISGLAFWVTDYIIKAHYEARLNTVREGETYSITIREESRRKDGSFLVATVNPEFTLDNGENERLEVEFNESGEIAKKPEWADREVKKKEFDNIIYIVNANPELRAPRQARARIERIDASNCRIAYASIV